MTNTYEITELQIRNRNIVQEAIAYQSYLHSQFPECGYDQMSRTDFMLDVYMKQVHEKGIGLQEAIALVRSRETLEERV